MFFSIVQKILYEANVKKAKLRIYVSTMNLNVTFR